ncbi:MAG: hypothetical protein BMS9Abin37_1084 [Acidobacteriota bacterium]|nr:MAG: hypothetical protein BMS9Abin37_1084 [Acidobacteriota bacterium]
MTNGQVPPIPQQEKKGLGPWVWLGIGCAGILALSAVAFGIASYFIYGKAKEVARDPVAATAQLIAAANPEIELVDADKNNRTITFRNTETGEEFTFDYDDIEEGKFSFTSGDESASIAFDAESDDGGMTIATGDGLTMTYGAGASEHPDWVSVYPGTEPQGTYASETPEMRAGAFSFETTDGLEQVLDFYVSELEAAGFVIQNRTTTPTGAIIIATTSDEIRSVTVNASVNDDNIGVMVNFTEKK